MYEWCFNTQNVEIVPRVGVIIVRNRVATNKKEYLSVFQNASKLWGFPKGSLKHNECHTFGAVRELFEETGVIVNPRALSYDNLYHIKRGKHHHYYFLMDISSDNPSNSDLYITVDGVEIVDHKWMTIEEMLNLRISYFTEQVLRRIIRSSSSSIERREVKHIPRQEISV